jgi:hypothetical protein
LPSWQNPFGKTATTQNPYQYLYTDMDKWQLAYVVGKSIGKKRSYLNAYHPKKTIEGFVGVAFVRLPVIWFQNIISKSPKEKYLFGS